MTKEQLNKVLEKHKKWLNDEPGGEWANLRGANLRRADLQQANLQEADLRGADLQQANLRRADLQQANLQGADLWGADLWEADLWGANLQEADLWEAKLQGANNIPNYICPICCPEEGSFVGFKRAYAVDKYIQVIVKLEIPAEAKRSSATNRKCRCNKAKVLSITDLQGIAEFQMAVSIWDNNFIYEVGKTVIVDDYDDNRWNECSTGIHFFITRDEAVNY